MSLLERKVPDAATRELLLRHIDWLLAINDSIKLTAITDYDQAIRLHLIDSLLIAEEVTKALEGKVLDMGTGGGFPAIPIAAVTSRNVTALDSVKKKMTALQAFIDGEPSLLGHTATCALRAEELALQAAEEYSCITARALSSLPSLVELASPLLRKNGCLIAMKGAIDDEEITRGDSVAKYCGMRRTKLERYILPGGEDNRTVIIYTKVGESKTKLPRRNGLAQRKPFA